MEKADSEISVHDNLVYAQIVDHEHASIVLHTGFPPEAEFTDVVFSGVVVHHFEQQTVGPENHVVLFDIEEEDPTTLLEQYSELLNRTKNYGWPVSGYSGMEDLVARLTADGARCYRVQGNTGIEGFVFAKEVSIARRSSKAAFR